MENNDKKVQNAPSSDQTQALFVSSRKKQLEEQEAQRIAAEKEAQRIAAEEEVKRLELEVAERKRQAEEDAKRIEAEAIERKRRAEEDAKKMEVEAAERKQKAEEEAKKAALDAKKAEIAAQGKKLQSDITGKLGSTASNLQNKFTKNEKTDTPSPKAPTGDAATAAAPDKQKMMMFGGIGAVAIVIIAVMVMLLGGGGIKESELQGVWYASNGLSMIDFIGDEFEMTSVTGEMAVGAYEIDDTTVYLLEGDVPIVTLTMNEDLMLYALELDTTYSREGDLNIYAITSQDDLYGSWYSTDGTAALYLYEEEYEFSDSVETVYYDMYYFYGDHITLYTDGSPAYDVLFQGANLYMPDFDITFVRDGYLAEPTSAQIAEVIPGQWQVYETTMVILPSSDGVTGKAHYYQNGNFLFENIYEIEDDVVVCHVGGEKYPYTFVSATQLVDVDGYIIEKISDNY